MPRLAVEDVIKDNSSYYALVIAVAKRAREISEEAEEKKETVMECFPDSEMAEEYRKLAEAIYELSKRPEGSACEKADEKYTADKRPGEGLKC